ncbi:hypothetical protein AXG93_2787s1030 [Marchantia polymorpha subsp. ruderalis]|uniref:Uncharacterized protein n=1 Tax=Marchantia polymorpha subsp. ruderalis TaxID=1480154 RepID=A0A176VWM6_MARPO|nr:hypothetical protein AXG93_2787s1030 [Marchantia polymorpha subsp. ruderalis]
MIPLKLPQIGLRAFQHELTAVKLDFLLWGWNYVCQDMVREWQKERDQPTRGFRPHVERWAIEDWEQVLGRCAGEDGHLLFDSESIKVTKEEEISFAALFKSSKSSKNGYVRLAVVNKLTKAQLMLTLQQEDMALARFMLQPPNSKFRNDNFLTWRDIGSQMCWNKLISSWN